MPLCQFWCSLKSPKECQSWNAGSKFVVRSMRTLPMGFSMHSNVRSAHCPASFCKFAYEVQAVAAASSGCRQASRAGDVSLFAVAARWSRPVKQQMERQQKSGLRDMSSARLLHVQGQQEARLLPVSCLNWVCGMASRPVFVTFGDHQ